MLQVQREGAPDAHSVARPAPCPCRKQRAQPAQAGCATPCASDINPLCSCGHRAYRCDLTDRMYVETLSLGSRWLPIVHICIAARDGDAMPGTELGYKYEGPDDGNDHRALTTSRAYPTSCFFLETPHTIHAWCESVGV